MTARTYELPMPPTRSAYQGQKVVTARGRTMAIAYITREGKNYWADVQAAVNAQHPDVGFEEPARLTVDVIAHYNRNAAYDLDNRLKALLDAGTKAGIWGDDDQIDDLRIRRGSVEKPAYVLVHVSDEVEPLPEETP
jgi:crossover junction endodeoxyribonuclease RusA